MVLAHADKLRTKIQNLSLGKKQPKLTLADVQPALDYIQSYWRKLERYHPKDDENIIGLPNKFLVPSFEQGHEFDFNEMYYWDSYFMVQGILDDQDKDFIIGTLDNLVYLFNRFKIIPNASRLYLTGRSHPPLLSSFIWDVYESYNLDEKWLDDRMKVAIEEYETVWLGVRKPNARQVYGGLSRYYDINYIHDLAEAESGWDMTPRFNRRAMDYLPVDLNSLLYKYEVDFARYYQLKNDLDKSQYWENAAENRKNTMNELMWSKLKNMYFDYNFIKEKKGSVSSLAAYYTMWAGLATEEQAEKLVKNLSRFEYDGGLSTTDLQPNMYVIGTPVTPTQWAYPNGWAPLHFILIEGLEKYGYREDAERIARKWLKTNLDWFNEHGVFLEKYNVVSPAKPPQKGLYPSQTGFGWTNSVFAYLSKKYL